MRIATAFQQISTPNKKQAKGNGGLHKASVQNNHLPKVRMIVAHYAVNHPEALREALKTAPESVKPALRRAIAVSVTGVLTTLD